MSEITYIFGAGASCQAMPLVNDFAERFSVFDHYIQISSDIAPEALRREVTIFKEALTSHSSFDTYFKKLFHQGESDLIRTHKGILQLYFLFEHLVKVEVIESLATYKKLIETKNKKTYNFDPRYESLIAGLLTDKELDGVFFKR